ncbi:MAG TPA: GNAT family N-acetyltransferase [Polyangiaceae bacterium]|nr:GNAT family N-acetyltransferase [Polyangiaceae bacterium]
MIRYADSHDIDLEQLAHLFVTAGWPHRAADRSKLALLVSRSLYVSTAHDGDRLVAFARALSDGVSNAYISTVCVLPDYRGRGIGREVVRRMVEREGGTGIRWVLHARKELHPFYGLNGFVEAPDILWRDRIR